MDKQNPTPKNAAPGLSIRNGPVQRMDIDGDDAQETTRNGIGKRRARPSNGKSYKEDSSDMDDKPLVSLAITTCCPVEHC